MHWFYLDFYLEENPQLPAFKLPQFLTKVLQHWPLLSPLVPRSAEIYQRK